MHSTHMYHMTNSCKLAARDPMTLSDYHPQCGIFGPLCSISHWLWRSRRGFYHNFSVLNDSSRSNATKPSRLTTSQISLEELTQNRPCGRWHANRHLVGVPERDRSLSQGRVLLNKKTQEEMPL